jgi:L-cysteine:1D-myo-inositol 2-amino-2-deoxy-alpha-D-glucopyranoside ligase
VDGVQLFNSLTQQYELFEPRGERVSLYVCGVTPYDTAHLGHAFVYSTFDVLIRFLRFRRFDVHYVQNVTDIDDVLFERVRELGDIAWDVLARRETEVFVRAMQALNISAPDHLVPASDQIPAMLKLIAQLLENGFAYVSDGWVYFSVRHDPEFGRLAYAAGLLDYAQRLEVANQHGNQPDDPRKQDPLDFVLWRRSEPGEPSWPSPWGAGRPGWHIECSAIATTFLGAQLDIHGGGADLIFPHHSCEIAQSERTVAAHPWARYWMHVGLVQLGGTKMSKSLGNLISVHNLLRTYAPDAVRILLASHQYRSPWEFRLAEMEQAQRTADSFAAAARGSCRDEEPPPDSFTAWAEGAFLNALDHDLDTPQALRVLELLARATTHDLLPGTERDIARYRILGLAGLLGLRLDGLAA